jgi:predicted HTH domain antitoxin
LLGAKLAMAAKLYELKRLSSGQAASLIGMDRLSFLAQLPRFGVPVIELAPDDIAEDIRNA